MNQKVTAEPEELLERYLSGSCALACIAEDFGVSRERIRQITTRTWHEIGYEGSPAAERFRNRAEYQKLERFRDLAAKAVPCVLCGYWAIRPHGTSLHRTCSHACAEAVAGSGGYITNADVRHRHKLSNARWIIAHPDHPAATPSKLRWARRFLSGAPIASRPRWVLPGSKVAERVRRIAPEKVPQVSGNLTWEVAS